MNPQRLKSIVKHFEACRYRHDLYTVFSDFCEMAAISLSNAVDLRQRETREARYLEIVGRYDADTIAIFPKILGEITMTLEEGPCDVLGATFHALELHNKARGQFFTPYSLCQLMAGMQIGDGLAKTIEARGYVTAAEPAVGAGALIIALAEAIQQAGFNYQQQLHVTAVDIDPRAVHMAYIQFSLMHIPATVIVGDTLRLTEREHWFTPAHIMGGWTSRLRRDLPAAPAIPQAPEVDRAEPRPAVGQLALF